MRTSPFSMLSNCSEPIQELNTGSPSSRRKRSRAAAHIVFSSRLFLIACAIVPLCLFLLAGSSGAPFLFEISVDIRRFARPRPPWPWHSLLRHLLLSLWHSRSTSAPPEPPEQSFPVCARAFRAGNHISIFELLCWL